MKRIIFIFLLLIFTAIVRAQQSYDASLIPAPLLTHASSVVRDEEMTVNVEDLNSTIVHVKKAITVLNKNGDDHAVLHLTYDKSTNIRSIKGAIFNSFGKQVAKFSEGDFQDQSAWDGFSLFLGDKIKYYRPAVTEYPYTVVYEYEQRYKQSLDFPKWKPCPGWGVSVEKSGFTFICKPGFNIRYKETNYPGKAIITNGQGGLKTYTWSVSDQKAIKYEEYSPYYGKYLTSVQIAPEKFEFYGIEGSFNNWQDLGKWEYDKLLASRRELPQETIDHVREITKDITDPRMKAKKIYEYMQRKTHYVSVQVGIGGNQPFLASDVDKQNYGDCKALVNYTQALLKAVDIDSYYCVVESGDFKVDLLKDFPSMEQGNHIILCLPFKNDTTWADCTSQTLPFGYLGSFTDDRYVLACTPEGGKLMHTPKYTGQDNLESRKAIFTINDAGELSGNMTTIFKGTAYEDRDIIVNEPQKDQYKMLQKIYPINNLEVEQLQLKQDKSFDPTTTESINLRARDYASISNGKYFFMLNAANREEEIPRRVNNRQNDVYINRGITNVDEIVYTVPEGYHLEKVPLNLNIDKPFGKFTATMQLSGNQLTYKRKFQLIDGTYSKDTYQDLIDFYQDVVDADSYTVSLVKN